MGDKDDMSAIGFVFRVAGAGVAMIGIPFGVIRATSSTEIAMTFGAIAAAFVILCVVRLFNLGSDSAPATPPDDPRD